MPEQSTTEEVRRALDGQPEKEGGQEPPGSEGKPPGAEGKGKPPGGAGEGKPPGADSGSPAEEGGDRGGRDGGGRTRRR